jgi:hypothetical protein
MLELKLAGLTDRAIAEMVDCTPQSVSIVSRSPLFKAELNRRLKERNSDGVVEEVEAGIGKARLILEQNSAKAAETQVELLDCEDDSVRLRSAGSILDRALGKPESQQASGGAQVNVQITGKDAQVIVTALHESKEITNGQVRQQVESTADGSSADPSENGQGDVHQTPLLGPGVGHRSPEAQASEEQVTQDSPTQPNGG